MKIPLRLYVKATISFFRAVRKHGLDATNERIEQIGTQSNFWFNECKRLHAMTVAAYDAGEIELFNQLRGQHIIALRKFNREVQQPLNELMER